MAETRSNLLIGIHSVASALSNTPGQVNVIIVAEECHNPRVRKLLQQAGELGIQIASGIEAAHEAGVIHRDLKPANIMIDREGRARVADSSSNSTDTFARVMGVRSSWLIPSSI